MAYLADYADTNAASLYGEAPANAGMTPGEEQGHLLAYAPLVKRIVRQLNSQVSGTMSREDMAARCRNSATEGFDASSPSGGIGSQSGTGKGSSGYSCSP